MLDNRDKPRIPVRRGDKWLVLILAVVAIAAFAGLAWRFSDNEEWGGDPTMGLMVKLLETIGVFFVFGILVAFFRWQKFETILLRHYFKLLLTLAAIILALIIVH